MWAGTREPGTKWVLGWLRSSRAVCPFTVQLGRCASPCLPMLRGQRGWQAGAGSQEGTGHVPASCGGRRHAWIWRLRLRKQVQMSWWPWTSHPAFLGLYLLLRTMEMKPPNSRSSGDQRRKGDNSGEAERLGCDGGD